MMSAGVLWPAMEARVRCRKSNRFPSVGTTIRIRVLTVAVSASGCVLAVAMR
jgi:hypothetical protein